ncbi:menaquinone-dependent protoporphyrinogen IX dehydrogenase [Pasteurellaceae bacterium HPA106]|uniref:menaquinone-dependent protoporphyrinogen IX dehydrogenase n=1 Tax=Spirabiliibacterium pneumoniae TaxID=221400 RepID=UPI001AACCA0B|nr:menaquinone-dependent protoporphyrinogen IX dehydrogenase [Spirabiliibacterium pneumoniae]MBE2896991.1 menaquinone-dependent protoporphyrinogen IX dehydrogenase [Spirabiliibacterium pneumoniae]
MTTLFIYSTREGQTLKIATAIAEKLRRTGIDTKLMALSEALNCDLRRFDSVIIGASIRYGHFDRTLATFVNRHYELLNRIPSAFFSVNLTARKPDKNTPQTNVYTRKFLARIDWQPSISTVFAGALYYPRYRPFDRIMIQFIMRLTGGETDTTKEVEYTDWHRVDAFADVLKKLLE